MRINFNLNISWQYVLMNGAKICQHKIWRPRNYQMTSHFGNDIILSL